MHEQQHFGRAAAACYVSQSTLSVGIAELERLLGAVLVERSKRSLRFTAVGEEVAARARAMIRAAEDLSTVARGSREPLVGPVRLAIIPTVAPFVLPRILAGVEARWPRLRLFVREMLTSAACDASGRGAVDCVLLALPADCADHDWLELFADPLLLALPEAEADRAAFEDAIEPERLLLLEDGHCLRDQALAACNLSGPAAPDVPLVASTLETLVRLVDAGLGVTLLPQMGVDAGILAGARVRSRTIKGLNAERRIALAWRRGHSRAEEFGLLAETIRDAVRPQA